MPSLLERESLLAALDAYLAEALGGRGRLVFLGGEAGAGKTSLVTAFAATAGVRVLRGACDGGSTPRPLGPLADVAAELGPTVGQELERDRPSRGPLFHATRAALGQRPTLLVIEDAHWADEATLDLIRFLGRRLDGTPVLVVITFRDDEVGPAHPLTVVLGDLATAAVVARMRVPLLTAAAVTELARRAGRSDLVEDAAELYERSCGNAFFVTEILAAGTERVPPSVRDAVHARAAQLSPAAHDALAAAAIIGSPAEVGLVLAVCGRPPEALDECVERGLLTGTGDRVAFRHELARLAIAEGLPAATRIRLHHAVFEHLRDSADDRRLAHHAEAAGAAAAVVRHAPRAAERAARLGSHREAAEHYRAALRHGHLLPDAERAELLGRLSYECYLTDQLDDALAARARALELHRAAGDAYRVGAGLRWLSRLSWFLGRNADAERFGDEAVAALEALEPGAELAMAYSNVAQLRMLAADADLALAWGDRAIELAERIGDQDVLVHALNNVGVAHVLAGEVAEGVACLRRSLDLALAADAEEHAARAYTNLGCEHANLRRFTEAEDWLRTGIAYCAEHDLDSWRLYMEAWLARVLAERGRYDAASRLARQILRHPRVAPITRIPALAVAGVVAVRRGEPAGAALDEAWRLAARTGELQRLVQVAVARAELAWTGGDPARIGPETEEVWRAALDRGSVWDVAELAFWRGIGGAATESGRELPEPFTLEPGPAAKAWADVGCPLWQALALSRSDDTADVRAGLGILDELGAVSTARAVARDVRERGLAVPRGPRPSTRDNPAGLTARELEVLRLLAEGLSNAELALRLRLSEKTVGHHVSAVLRKLGVPSRSRAVAVAAQLGIPT